MTREHMTPAEELAFEEVYEFLMLIAPKGSRASVFESGCPPFELYFFCKGSDPEIGYYCARDPGHSGQCYSASKQVRFDPTNTLEMFASRGQSGSGEEGAQGVRTGAREPLDVNPYRKILDAAARERHVVLSAAEVSAMARDHAIITAAESTEDKDELPCEHEWTPTPTDRDPGHRSCVKCRAARS